MPITSQTCVCQGMPDFSTNTFHHFSRGLLGARVYLSVNSCVSHLSVHTSTLVPPTICQSISQPIFKVINHWMPCSHDSYHMSQFQLVDVRCSYHVMLMS